MAGHGRRRGSGQARFHSSESRPGRRRDQPSLTHLYAGKRAAFKLTRLAPWQRAAASLHSPRPGRGWAHPSHPGRGRGQASNASPRPPRLGFTPRPGSGQAFKFLPSGSPGLPSFPVLPCPGTASSGQASFALPGRGRSSLASRLSRSGRGNYLIVPRPGFTCLRVARDSEVIRLA